MFTQRLKDRNPGLLEAAVNLHQGGRLPPNSFLIDLDAIAHNAKILAAEAKRLGLTTYVMTKQFARNPYVTAVAQANGLGKVVSVDVTCSLLARRYSLPVGHMGHLNQIPRHMVPGMVAMRPDVISVYNVEHAQWIDKAAADLGTVQELLIRVSSPGDVFFDGQEGGFSEADVPAVVEAIGRLRHVRIVGVTAFPCIRYNPGAGEAAEPTPNLHTIVRAANKLRELGLDVKQINTPGNTSSATMAVLARHGATHVEPGHGLTGTTPNHAHRDDLPELPAYVYVSEISHHVGGRPYAYGGGLFHDMHIAGSPGALVGSTWQEASENSAEFLGGIKQVIDYHVVLEPSGVANSGAGNRYRPGDTVLMAHRTQMQMNRSYVAVVSGASAGTPKLHHIFDPSGSALDNNYDPIPPSRVKGDVDELISVTYQQ